MKELVELLMIRLSIIRNFEPKKETI